MAETPARNSNQDVNTTRTLDFNHDSRCPAPRSTTMDAPLPTNASSRNTTLCRCRGFRERCRRQMLPMFLPSCGAACQPQPPLDSFSPCHLPSRGLPAVSEAAGHRPGRGSCTAAAAAGLLDQSGWASCTRAASRSRRMTCRYGLAGGDGGVLFSRLTNCTWQRCDAGICFCVPHTGRVTLALN